MAQSKSIRTGERIRDHNQDPLHRIHPLQLLQQPQIQQRVRLSIAQQYTLRLGARLPLDAFDERELVRRDQPCALVALHPSFSKIGIYALQEGTHGPGHLLGADLGGLVVYE